LIKTEQFREKASSVYVYLLLTAYILCPPPEGYRAIVEFKYALFMGMTACYAAAMLLSLFLARKTLGRLRREELLALAFLGFTALSALLSPWREHTLIGTDRRDGLLTALAYTAIFFFLARHFRPKREHLYAFAFSATAYCAVVILQMCGRNPFGMYPRGLTYFDANVRYSGVYIGTLGNADIAAAVLCMAPPAFFTAAVFRRKSPFELLLLVPAALCLAVLIETNCAGGSCAAVAATILAVPAACRSKKVRRISAAAALTAGALFIVWLLCYRGKQWGVFHQASELLHGRAEESYGSGRIYIWKRVLEKVPERLLFGGGPDTLPLRGIAPYEWLRADGKLISSEITAAHSEYLNILVNCGAFALAAYLALLVSAAARWYRRGGGAARTVCGAAACAYLAQAFFGVSMCLNTPFLWLALACVCSFKEEKRPGG